MAEMQGVPTPFSNSYERSPIEGELMPTLSNETSQPSVALDPATMVENMYGYGPVQAANAQQEKAAAEAARIESIKILDKDAFKLGNLNPLINRADLTRKESVDALRYTILEKIQATDSLTPKVLESAVAMDMESGKAELRFVARFEVDNLTPEQLSLLEELVEQTYGLTVRTRTDSKGNDITPQDYPPLQPGEEMKSKTGGWYMGPYPVPTTTLHQGLFVFKDYGPIDKNNFLNDDRTPLKFIIEIREASQYQTDLATFVTQVASILKHEKLPDRGQLLYETYYDLIRLSLKGTEEEAVYGMEEAADMIRRELILPLASPDISAGLKEDPQSVLMIGVPGTGKTLLVERLLQEETGLFVLPIDPFELQKELALPKEKQYLMPRIAEVARITGKQVILHVDDIENMVTENEVTNSTMLNLMAGVQESGFHIIASTNYPEKINPSLIQPQRFSVLIHCGLQNEQARYEILKIHANMQSEKLDIPLFESEEVRDIVLKAVAYHTEGFTPRYLSNVATIAKSHLLARVAAATSKTIGLAESELRGHTFTVEDWDKALVEVSAKYDSKSVRDKDKEIAQFVKKHRMYQPGFTPSDEDRTTSILSSEVLARVAAARSRGGAILNQVLDSGDSESTPSA